MQLLTTVHAKTLPYGSLLPKTQRSQDQISQIIRTSNAATVKAFRITRSITLNLVQIFRHLRLFPRGGGLLDRNHPNSDITD